MAESVHDAEDFEAHKATYASFVTGAKWGVGAVALILILMAVFLL